MRCVCVCVCVHTCVCVCVRGVLFFPREKLISKLLVCVMSLCVWRVRPFVSLRACVCVRVRVCVYILCSYVSNPHTRVYRVYGEIPTSCVCVCLLFYPHTNTLFLGSSHITSRPHAPRKVAEGFADDQTIQRFRPHRQGAILILRIHRPSQFDTFFCRIYL